MQENEEQCVCTLVSLKIKFRFIKKSLGTIHRSINKDEQSEKIRQRQAGGDCRSSDLLGDSHPYRNKGCNIRW